MIPKTAFGTNSERHVDDALSDTLLAYSGMEDAKRKTEQDIAFALLYIADKLDSIDTRLFHLVNQEGKKHE